jgi:hypothetical protein
VFTATRYTTEKSQKSTDENETREDFFEFEFAIIKPDKQLAFIHSKIYVSNIEQFKNLEWDCQYKSMTYHSERAVEDQYGVLETLSVNSGIRKYTLALCEKQNLDIYMNGNRVVTLEGTIRAGFDDQNIFVSKMTTVKITSEELQELLDTRAQYKEWGYDDDEIKMYVGPQYVDPQLKMEKEMFFQIDLQQGANICWDAANMLDVEDQIEMSNTYYSEEQIVIKSA